MSFGDVKVRVGVDLKRLAQRDLVGEQAVMRRHEAIIVNKIQTKWVGWKYKGRPPGAPRNVSQKEWKATSEVEGSSRLLVVRNNARDFRRGKPYVVFVHRAGTNPKIKVWRDEIFPLVAAHTPELLRDLSAAVLTEFSKVNI